MTHINTLIKAAENIWLERLFTYNKDAFSNMHIPSHDHTHHLRVWNIAKKLIAELAKKGQTFTQNDIEQVIIAVFFHDIGMTITLDKKHGIESRKICEAFFKDKKSQKPKQFRDVLDAIEKHDDKEYKYNVYHSNRTAHNALPLLCVSDDLDAFGTVGALRYAEIYLLRGIKVNKLPSNVINNLNTRYSNFFNLYHRLEKLVTDNKERYKITKKYYSDLEIQLQSVKYSETILQGPIGVINILKNEVMNSNITFDNLADLVLLSNHDIFVTNFFKSFKKEISLLTS